MQIHTQNVIILPPTATADAMASMERLMQSIGRAEAPAVAAQPGLKPQIGDYWTGQGGFYAGDMRGDDGTIYGLIVSDCGDTKDAGSAKWGPDGERDLSHWDGLDNTRRLVNEYPAAKLATTHSADEHKDFYLPARRELQLAAANVPHLFGDESWYWSSTHYGQSTAWAVDFEYGNTHSTTGATSSEFVPSADSTEKIYGYWLFAREAGAGVFRLPPAQTNHGQRFAVRAGAGAQPHATA